MINRFSFLFYKKINFATENIVLKTYAVVVAHINQVKVIHKAPKLSQPVCESL